MKQHQLFYRLSLTTALALFSLGINQPLVHSSEGQPHHSGGHSHGQIEIAPGEPVPQVNLIIHPDPKMGWNLEMQVENFQFTPHHLYQENKPGEGHVHLFINGEKVTRIYGSWYYLKELPPGNHEIKVVLSSNNHEDFIFQGQMIQDTEMIRVD
jgi:hypothetical protein